MNVTAYQLKTRSGEFLERAAAGEEIVITKRGVVKAKLVPPDHFDAHTQARVLDNMAKIRNQLAEKGKKFTQSELRSAIKDGRH